MRKIIVIVSLGLLAACSGKKFSGNSPTGKDAPPPPKAIPNTEDSSVPIPNTPVTLPPPAKGLVERCDQEVANLQTITQDIVFPESNGCDTISTDIENQVRVTAVESQSVDLNLPDGEICSLTLDSQSGDVIRYDDFLVLTIDDKVLFASNNLLINFLPEQSGVYSWDFEKVKNNRLADKNDTGSPSSANNAAWSALQYCLGRAIIDEDDDEGCEIPRTEQAGLFDVKFEAKNFAPIALAINGKSSVPVTLNTTGDNDPDKDCKHTEINLKATIKFLPK